MSNCGTGECRYFGWRCIFFTFNMASPFSVLNILFTSPPPHVLSSSKTPVFTRKLLGLSSP